MPGLEQRGVDALAFPGLQPVHVRGEHAHRGENAGGDIGHRRAALHRRAPGSLSGDAHQPGHPLRDQVEAAALGIRAGAPEARDLAVDQSRIDLAQRLVAQAEALHRALAEVLDCHVGGAQQSASDLQPFRVLEVHRDPALVAVHHQVGGGLALDDRRDRAAAVVAVRQLLQLDHVGAHVGEHQAAGRAGHDVRQLDHLEAGERSHVSAP